MSDDETSLRSNFNWSYALLGSLFSAFAIVSLTQKIFAIGLSPTMLEILNYYKAAMHPVSEFFLGVWHWLAPDWQIPDWMKDLFPLAFVGGSAVGRAQIISYQGSTTLAGRFLYPLFSGMFHGTLLIGILAWPVAVLTLLKPDSQRDKIERHLPIILATALTASVAFFAINAQL